MNLRPGDKWIGDPPHETPGLYSVYDKDNSTLEIISAHAERKEHYNAFITAYLAEVPIRKEELKWLHLVLRTRWLLQILLHQSRYMEGITQGLDSGKVEENLDGVRDGERFLKITNKTSKDFYFKTITE